MEQVPLESSEKPEQEVPPAETALPAHKVWSVLEVKEVPLARKVDKVVGVKPAHLVLRVRLANHSATTRQPLLHSWHRVNIKETQRQQFNLNKIRRIIKTNCVIRVQIL
jgi:hypothetical protein